MASNILNLRTGNIPDSGFLTVLIFFDYIDEGVIALFIISIKRKLGYFVESSHYPLNFTGGIMADIGDVLDQRYKLIKRLGQGKWGQVFLAENLKLGNRWAVKEVNMFGDSRVNLLAEPEILKRLNHPHIPRIVDIIIQGNQMYLIEDFFDGVNLKDLIADRERCNEQQVIHWGRQLGEVLVYLHHLKPNPIIYRDMKPGNIIIDGENHAKLVDFGIARAYEPSRQSDTAFIGTMGYAAPEQFGTGTLADKKTDIYGLGVTLYHVLTGLHPGGGIHPVRSINPKFSPILEKILLKCTDPRPEARYGDISEFLEDIKWMEKKNSFTGWGAFHKVLHIFDTGKVNYKRYTHKYNEGAKGAVIIAVAGAGRRVGCTHTAIVLSRYLASLKYRVALVELNGYNAFEWLMPEYITEDKVFSKKGVDFFPRKNIGHADQLGGIIRKGYHYILLDLGNSLAADGTDGTHLFLHRELQRANLQILVAGSAVWQLPEMLPYLRDDELGALKLVMTHSDPVLIKELREQVKKDIYGTPYNPNPFSISQEQERFCLNLLRDILSA